MIFKTDILININSNEPPSPLSTTHSTETSSSSEEPEEKKIETPEQLEQRINLASNEAKTTFRYELLFTRLISNNRFYVLDSQGVFMAKTEGQFIEFGYSILSEEEKRNPSSVSNVGWKVHLSLDDSTRNNLTAGFDLIKNIVIDERLTCKVVLPIAQFHLDLERNGRQITIYDCGNVNKDWQHILNRMENSLIESGTCYASNYRY